MMSLAAAGRETDLLSSDGLEGRARALAAHTACLLGGGDAVEDAELEAVDGADADAVAQGLTGGLLVSEKSLVNQVLQVATHGARTIAELWTDGSGRAVASPVLGSRPHQLCRRCLPMAETTPPESDKRHLGETQGR